MMAPMLTTFNSYFTKKMNLMMGIAQSMLVLGVMLSPYVAEITIKNIGFRYTLCVLAALALLTFAAASVLVPVERHMKRVYKDDQSDGGKYILSKFKTLVLGKYIFPSVNNKY